MLIRLVESSADASADANLGLRHFKSRFRPRYESLYVCAWLKLSIGSIVAFFQASGAYQLSLAKLGRIALDR